MTPLAWLSTLADLSARRVPCALITVTSAKGSTPRDAGTKMVATMTEQFGTIGGGNLEFEAVAEARRVLAAASSGVVSKDYPLGPKLAQCCGGAVSVLIEPFVPSAKRVFIFGAGHVGKEIVRVLAPLSVDVIWVDERADEFPTDIPLACHRVVSAQPVDKVRDITQKDFMIVLTHSHALDYELVRAALRHGHFAYLGLIGSATKKTRFTKRLKDDGATDSDLARLTCPIGIPGIVGKHPSEIAVAVVAELLQQGLTRDGAAIPESAKD